MMTMPLWGRLVFVSLTVSLLLALTVPRTTDAADSNVVRLVAYRHLATELFHTIVPLPGRTVAGTKETTFAIVEVRYCGAIDDRRGDFVAVVLPAPPPPSLQRVLIDGDCMTTLQEIAARVSPLYPSPAWVSAARLSITWVPWELRITGVDAVAAVRTPVEQTSADAVVGALKDPSHILKVISTVDITPAAAQPNLEYNLAFTFGATRLEVSLVPKSLSATWVQPSGLTVNVTGAPDLGNVIAAIPIPYLNEVFTANLHDVSLYKIPVESETVLVQNVRVNGADMALTTRGDAIYPKPVSTFAVTLNWAGDDLKLKSAQVVSSYAGDPIKKAILDAVARAVEQKFNGPPYKDSPFRPMNMHNSLPAKIGERTFTLRPQILRSSASTTTLFLYGIVVVEPP
jgi:hypothetical protein